MALGKKTGGRQAGTPNKHTTAKKLAFAECVAEGLAAHGFGTFGELVVARMFSEDVRERIAAFNLAGAKIVPDPARRIEATGPDGGPVEFRFVEHRAGAVS